MENISATGLEIIVKASVTFPAGIRITEFVDDADPLDIPDLQTADYGMGINGDLIVWNAPKPLEVNLNIIPLTESDRNLTILFDANRVAKNKQSVKDKITFTALYPDGTKRTFQNGVISGGIISNAVASSGRIKSKNYKFVFENIITY